MKRVNSPCACWASFSMALYPCKSGPEQVRTSATSKRLGLVQLQQKPCPFSRSEARSGNAGHPARSSSLRPARSQACSQACSSRRSRRSGRMKRARVPNSRWRQTEFGQLCRDRPRFHGEQTRHSHTAEPSARCSRAWSIPEIYSGRSVAAGSTLSARRIGIRVAVTAVAANRVATETQATGSAGSISKSRLSR